MYDHDVKCGFSFLHLLLCTLTVTQGVSYFRLLYCIHMLTILCMIMILNVVSLSSTCYYVNMCPAIKLLSLLHIPSLAFSTCYYCIDGNFHRSKFSQFSQPMTKCKNKIWTCKLFNLWNFSRTFCVLVSLNLTIGLYRYFRLADNVLLSPMGDLLSSVSPTMIKGIIKSSR